MYYSKKNLRFGVELEGLFKNKLHDKLCHEACFKSDGSVEFNSDEIEDFGFYEHNSREVASKVLNYGGLIKFLKHFDEKNYKYNNTTGYHLHISSLKNNDGFLSIMANYEFIKTIQKMALNDFCSCQEERLTTDDFFFKPYTSSLRVIKNFNDHDHVNKYYFLRFHPQNTIEFRFLKPCEHKIENTKKLIEAIINYVNAKNKTIFGIDKPKALKEEAIEYNFKANETQVNLNL